MLIQLPGGGALNVDGSEIDAKDNGEVRLHTPLALSRLIERWKAENNPQLANLLSAYTDEVQELENAIWDVMVGRLTDYAVGIQLDALGRIVGQKRESLGDAAYRAHIKARIRINQSFGQPRDIIVVIKLVDSAAFHIAEFPIAAFRVWFDEPPANASVGHELPSLIRQTRAAGVSGMVTFPVDRLTSRGAFFGSSYDPALNVARGSSSSYDSTVGGLFGHAART